MMRILSSPAVKAAKATALCLLISLAGCASLGGNRPEDQVKARAQARRDAIVQADFGRAYEFFGPGFRGTVSVESYKKSIGDAARVVGASVESVTCETLEKCVAKVKVEIKPLAVPRFTGTITSYSDETWLFEAGQWWFYQSL
jgi:hypothetical protein